MSKRRTDDVIELLATTWPECFSIYEQRRRPLKIGVHLDILAGLAGTITPAELSRALRLYVTNRIYRARLVAGAARVDLNGEVAGQVTPEQVPSTTTPPHVRRSRAAQSAPPPVAPPPATPRRLSLSDLREAARRRREMTVAAAS
jgi:ProP effector